MVGALRLDRGVSSSYCFLARVITFGNEEPATESNKNENKGFHIEALKRLMVFQDR